VPAPQALVGRRRGPRLDGHRLVDDIGAHLALGTQAQQPVDAHLGRDRDGGDGLRPRQACAFGGQQLGQGGAIGTDAAGELAATDARTLDHLLQTAAEDLHGLASVHGAGPNDGSCRTKLTNV
jgi:hypothetical protein